jgi:hypothetical protein
MRKAVDQNVSDRDFAQSILFTNDLAIVKREKDFIYSRYGSEQEVHFFNDSKLLVSKKVPPRPLPPTQTNLARPMTSVTHRM